MKSILGGVLSNLAPVPLGGTSRSSVFAPPSSGSKAATTKHLGAMEAVSTIFAIVDRLATSMSSQEWMVYRSAKRKEDRTAVDQHPALTVWNDPNPHMTRTEVVESMQQHFELTGEMWMLLGRSSLLSAGPPIEIWPVRPDLMRPVPNPREFISGYVYQNGRDEIPLRLDEVIYNKRPNPLNPYRGLGPIGSLMLDIEGEHAASAYNTMFFRNGAEPGGVFENPEILSDEEFEKLVQHWESQHKGVNNAHRIAVVEVGTWKDRSYTMRDMQFEQLRRFSGERFRQAYGFPKPMLGDVEDVNRANAEAAQFVFADQLLVPRLNRMRTMLNDDFLPLFGSMGSGYEFDYSDPVPVRQDERTRALSVSSFVREGFDPADTLKTFGFPPIKYNGPPDQIYAVPDSSSDTMSVDA